MQADAPLAASTEQTLVELWTRNMDAMAAEADDCVGTRVSLGTSTSAAQIMRERLATRLANMETVYSHLELLRTRMDERRALVARADTLKAMFDSELAWTDAIIATRSIERVNVTQQLQSEVASSQSHATSSFARFSALDARVWANQTAVKDKRTQIHALQSQVLALQDEVRLIEAESRQLTSEQHHARREFEMFLKTASRKQHVLQALLERAAAQQDTNTDDPTAEPELEGDGEAADDGRSATMQVDPQPRAASPMDDGAQRAAANSPVVLAAAVAAADAAAAAAVSCNPCGSPSKRTAAKTTASPAAAAIKRRSSMTHVAATQSSGGGSTLIAAGGAAPIMLDKGTVELANVRDALSSYIDQQTNSCGLSIEEVVAATAAKIASASGKATSIGFVQNVLDGTGSSFQPARLLRIAEFLRTAAAVPRTQSLPQAEATDDSNDASSGGERHIVDSTGVLHAARAAGVPATSGYLEMGLAGAFDTISAALEPLDAEPMVLLSYDALGSIHEDEQTMRPAKRPRDEEDEQGSRESTVEVDVLTLEEPASKRARRRL
eukprot:c4323_g1_i1.p1 GENE.c4323_g1_i1~~c4323_g1_i1.p1  ORF type:complete len:554 (-),score=72.32 c4323_g1_i1:62-1723(-)